MSSSTLPRLADLRKLAAAGASVSGSIAFADLPRLCEALVDDVGEAVVGLDIGSDEEGYRAMTGRVSAALRLECQRCLEPVTLAVDVSVSLAMVWREDEIAALPARYEGVVVGQEPSDLYAIVEDEVLLALPLVPLHDAEHCGTRAADPGDLAGQAEEGRQSPFAVLRALRTDKG